MLSMEVAVMLKLGAMKKTSQGAFAPVALLDWFHLDDKLILVLERPVPAENLLQYRDKQGCLEEKEAKVSWAHERKPDFSSTVHYLGMNVIFD